MNSLDKLISSLLRLISTCVQRKDPTNLFPNDFNEQLKTFLIETITKEIDTSKL